MKRDIKLYNLIFPDVGDIFLCHFVSVFFVLLLPANFIVDTVMLLLLFFLFKVPEKRSFTEGHLESMGLWISGGFSGGRGSGYLQQCGFAAV